MPKTLLLAAVAAVVGIILLSLGYRSASSYPAFKVRLGGSPTEAYILMVVGGAALIGAGAVAYHEFNRKQL